MAPVASLLFGLLALSAAAPSTEAKPLGAGGHGSVLSRSRRAIHHLMARYYGDNYGMTRPPPLSSLLHKRTNVPAGWDYFGCVDESWQQRLLQGFAFSEESLTPLLCMTECGKLGYQYAGMEYSDECYCGNAFVGNGGGLTNDWTCSMPCAGDADEMCGSAWFLSLYRYNNTGLASCSSAADPASASSSVVVGSGVAGTGASAIASATATSNSSSSSTASTTSTTLATLATGNALATPVTTSSTGAIPTVTASSSNTAAAAPTSTYATIVNPADASKWYVMGCAADSTASRLLTGASQLTLTSATVDSCLTTCNSQGFEYAGVEYGSQCFCGASLPAAVTWSTGSCNMTCNGNSSETCGGFDAIELFGLVSPATTTATISTPSTSSVVAAPTSTYATIVDSEDASEWYALGCAVDSTTTRLLTGASELTLASVTVDSCLTSCEDQGFEYAGVEYGSQCFCGASLPANVTWSTSGCTMACNGNSSETCGGFDAIELFRIVSASSTGSDCGNTTSSIGGEQLASPTSVVTSATATAGNATATVPTATTPATASGVASSVPSSASTHQVWAHHMVGNTYNYDESTWAADVAKAQSWGIDGFALNMGSDYWQPDNVNDAYTAANSTGFKLFLSLDMTSLPCASAADAQSIVSLVRRFAGLGAQAKVDNKPLVSTFAGDSCSFGGLGWKTGFVDALEAVGVDIFFVPSLFSNPSTFAADTEIDGELNWDSSWPTGGTDLTTASDELYMAALGSKAYMPAISPFFFTHFGANSWNKNWLYRSDDWLYCTRWEQVIAMRDKVFMAELLTWNDYGESSYIGPIEGDLPAGADAWVNGFDHQSLSALTQYYAAAFKTGAYPAVTTDKLILWARPHPHLAQASADPVGEPTGYQNTDDNLYAAVFATSAGSVTLTSGSTSQTFTVTAGLNKLKMPLAAGAIGGQLTRNGATVASYDSTGSFAYDLTPATYNFNYFVGSSA